MDYEWMQTECTIYEADSEFKIPSSDSDSSGDESEPEYVKSAGNVSVKVYEHDKHDDSTATDEESLAEYVKSERTVLMKVYGGNKYEHDDSSNSDDESKKLKR